MPLLATVAAPSAPPVTPARAGAAGPSFGAAFRRLAGAAAPALPPRGCASAARAALEGVERARERLDEALRAARGGRTFTPQELLALQADAYHFSQAVDVAARVVEQGAQAVRQAVATQV